MNRFSNVSDRRGGGHSSPGFSQHLSESVINRHIEKQNLNKSVQKGTFE